MDGVTRTESPTEPEPKPGDEGSAAQHPIALGALCLVLCALVLLRSGDRRSLRRRLTPSPAG